MRYEQTLAGIVLRTYDVGEADRLCILLTRERGRIAARARGVRKLASRFGPLLLPGRTLTLDLHDSPSGITVTGARADGTLADLSHPHALAVAQVGIELLLSLTDEGEPMENVFDLTGQFIRACAIDPTRTLLPFQLRLLHLLGLLPSHTDDRRFHLLSPDDRATVRSCAREENFGFLCLSVVSTPALETFLESLLTDHLSKELRSSKVAIALRR